MAPCSPPGRHCRTSVADGRAVFLPTYSNCLELNEEYETAQIVESFLTLATEKTVPITRNLDGILPLIQFLTKWDCEDALATLVDLLCDHAVECKLSPKRTFLLAAHLDDPRLAKAALRNCKSLKDRVGGPRTLIDPVPDHAVVDPLLWSCSMWERAQHQPNMDYILALSRAFREARKPGTLHDKFATYLAERQKRNAEESV